jgi:predicted ArsR family transcriptional regulator
MNLLDYIESRNAKARPTDPATSHVAAAGVDVTRSQRLVLETLAMVSPATAESVCERLAGQCSESRVRGALAELKQAGRVVVVGYSATRMGNPCEVYGRAK